MEFVKQTGPFYANVILIGPAKTGKTVGAASAPGGVLYINADTPNSTKYIHDHDTEGRIMEPKWEGKQLLSDVMHSVYREPRIVDTVVLDNYGRAYDRLLRERSGDATRPSLNQRGDVAVDLMRFAEFMVEAPAHFVIIAHAYTRQVETDEGPMLDTIAWTGSKSGSETTSPKLTAMVDIIGFTGIRRVENEPPQFVAQTAAGAGRQGGDRFGVLGDWAPLDLTDWFKRSGVWVPEENAGKAAAEPVAA